MFERIYVCTNDTAAKAIGVAMGVSIIDRGAADGDQADIVWVRQAIEAAGHPQAFAILRPTSPFRTARTIQRAVEVYSNSGADSIRAVELVAQHPGKMWVIVGRYMTPILSGRAYGNPWHSLPTQVLPPYYLQNSSLEIAGTSAVVAHGAIHGQRVAPFFTTGEEGFAIDTEADWLQAEAIARRPEWANYWEDCMR